MRNKNQYHIYHQSFLNPLFSQLQNRGASLDSIFSRYEFRRFNFHNPDSYLPMSVVYDLLQILQSDQRVVHIADTFYSNFQLDELGDFGEFISARPDLLTVILDGIKYESHIQTNTRMNLEISGSTARFSQVHLDPMSEGRQVAEDIAFAMAYNAFKMVLGNDWHPITLYIPRNGTESISHIVSEEDTDIVFNAPCYAWFFDTKLLSNKNLSMTQVKEPPNNDFSDLTGRIQRLLDGLSEGYLPTRSDFSNFLNTSESSIVRTLKAEGTAFSSLLEKHLLLKALKLMQDEKMNVLEVSQKLGYANAANFVRAFKKWTNTTPNQYRYQHNF